MLEQECGEYGSFKFEMPDIAQYLELLGASGFDSSNLQNAEGMNDLILTARMLRASKCLVKDIKVKVNDVEIKDYDELLKQRELTQFMMAFVGKVQMAFAEASKKK